MRYPETWVVAHPGPFVVRFLASQEETGFFVAPLTSPIVLPGQPLSQDRENLGVRPETEDVGQAIDEYIDTFKGDIDDFKITSRVTVESPRGEIVTFDGVSEEKEITTTVLVAEGGRELLAAVGVVRRGNRGEQSVVDGVLASFVTFKESPPDDHADTVQDASPVQINERVNGTIGWYDDVDVFAFQAEEGESYEANVDLVNFDDSFLLLLSSSDCVVSQNDDRDELNRSSRILWRASEDRAYYLAVSSSNNVRSGRPEDKSIGDFVLNITKKGAAPSDDYGNQQCSATAISPGDAVEGVLESSTDSSVC